MFVKYKEKNFAGELLVSHLYIIADMRPNAIQADHLVTDPCVLIQESVSIPDNKVHRPHIAVF